MIEKSPRRECLPVPLGFPIASVVGSGCSNYTARSPSGNWGLLVQSYPLLAAGVLARPYVFPSRSDVEDCEGLI